MKEWGFTVLVLVLLVLVSGALGYMVGIYTGQDVLIEIEIEPPKTNLPTL